jgi:hypothetical protein
MMAGLNVHARRIFAMPDVTFHGIFDTGQTFSETFHLFPAHRLPLPQRVESIVLKRLGMMAVNVRIVMIEGDGFPRQHVDHCGTAPGYGWPQATLNVSNDGRSADRISLRGAPSEFFVGVGQSGLSPVGTAALKAFGTALGDAGAYVVHYKEQRPVANLTMSSRGHLSGQTQPTLLRKLRRIFGAQRAQELWHNP